MTKKQIAFWRLIILVILLGGAILIGRAIHKKPKTDSVQSEFVNSNDEDTVTTTEGSEINNNNNKENIDSPTETKDSINSFEEDFKDDDNPDSVTKDSDNSSTDEDAVVEETEEKEQNQEEEKEVEPVEVDQTINLSIRSDDFFESPEEIDQTKVDKYDDSKNNNNKKLPNDNVTPSKKIHSLKNQEDQNNN